MFLPFHSSRNWTWTKAWLPVCFYKILLNFQLVRKFTILQGVIDKVRQYWYKVFKMFFHETFGYWIQKTAFGCRFLEYAKIFTFTVNLVVTCSNLDEHLIWMIIAANVLFLVVTWKLQNSAGHLVLLGFRSLGRCCLNTKAARRYL